MKKGHVRSPLYTLTSLHRHGGILLTALPWPSGAGPHTGQTFWLDYAKGGLPGDGRQATDSISKGS